MALWSQGGGDRNNGLILTTASNVNPWQNFANDFTQTMLDRGKRVLDKFRTLDHGLTIGRITG